MAIRVERQIAQEEGMNVDEVMRRLHPRLTTPSGEIRFEEVDDFHPDRLYARLDLFKALRQARANPPSKAAWSLTLSAEQPVIGAFELLMGSSAPPAAGHPPPRKHLHRFRSQMSHRADPEGTSFERGFDSPVGIEAEVEDLPDFA
jgi:hypothetical protein